MVMYPRREGLAKIEMNQTVEIKVGQVGINKFGKKQVSGFIGDKYFFLPTHQELVEKLLRAIEKKVERQVVDEKVGEADLLRERQEHTRQMTLDELEKLHIMEIMQECDGNLSVASKRLGIGRQKLYDRLRKYGLVV